MHPRFARSWPVTALPASFVGITHQERARTNDSLFGSLFGEVLQSFGTINPTRYVSGGPSNRITDMLVGAHYTIGPVTLRTSYSHGWDDNPSARHEMVVAGSTIKMTEHVDAYLEYVNEQVHGNALAERIEFVDSFQFVIHWHY